MSALNVSRTWVLALTLLGAAALVPACGGSTVTEDLPLKPAQTQVSVAFPRAAWPVWRHANRPLDLAGPLRDSSLVLAAGGRLWTLGPTGHQRLFSAAYDRPGNAEPYIAAPAPDHRGCPFGTDTVYALRLYGGRGVVAVRSHGPVRRFASITAPGLIDGITFDEAGSFGHRLLVTITDGARTTVQAIDCHGRVSTITRAAPRVEGGLIVATAPFGRFAGDLIAPDEKSGRLYAIGPDGRSQLMAVSGLPFGQDIGVESEVQLPRHRFAALLAADRLNPGNRHPGDNAILRLSVAALPSPIVHPGDLMVATEGGARLLDVSCRARSCQVREIAAGPGRAHLEGHLAAAPR